MNYRILIVDDEKPARTKTARFVQTHCPNAVISEADNGSKAVELILKTGPDLVFLDIQMPGMTGFEVIRKIDPNRLPPVIFVTAFDEYAVKAFDVNAVDYLLKPFDYQRFQKAFDKAMANREKADHVQTSIEKLIRQIHEKKSYINRITIKQDERIRFVDTADVMYIQAQGKYLDIHTPDQTFVIRNTLKSMENQLDPHLFYRIHRSFIVNIRYIKELQKWFHGDYHVLLTDGTQLKLSRRYSHLLLAETE